MLTHSPSTIADLTRLQRACEAVLFAPRPADFDDEFARIFDKPANDKRKPN